MTGAAWIAIVALVAGVVLVVWLVRDRVFHARQDEAAKRVRREVAVDRAEVIAIESGRTPDDTWATFEKNTEPDD